jgi:hypothetical protein
VRTDETQSHEADGQLYEIEVLDGEVVEHHQLPLESDAAERLPVWASTPAVQTVAAAATGFVAGAAMVALLRRYGQSRLERTTVPAAEPLAVSGRVHAYIVHVRPLRPYLD